MLAQLYKWAAIVFAVLAVAAVVTAILFHADSRNSDLRAAAEHERANVLAQQVLRAEEARKRAEVSSAETDAARSRTDDRTAEQTERQARIEVKYRDRIIEVPAVCPAPDADLLRELAEGAARVSATEGRLRGLRRAEGQAAE
jgi:hypothetical protein